ncbi:MAG: hypothetical protein VKJ24_03070 [Synechococcales bacterium]|nr:hypothetical protein [Synechococcales bacterium]
MYRNPWGNSSFTDLSDRALIEQMAPAMEGLFGLAYDPRGLKAGIYSEYQAIAAGQVAQGLVSDERSVREQVFQATLLGVVTEVWHQQGWLGAIAGSEQQQALIQAVMELAQTYTWLAPQGEVMSSVPEGFLQALWRLQMPDGQGRFAGGATIAETLERSLMDLTQLLSGVSDPLRGIQFLNGLVQGAVNVPSLAEEMRQGDFLAALMELGWTVLRVNPTVIIGNNDYRNWVESLLEGTMTTAESGLSVLFAGFHTWQEKVSALQKATALLQATQTFTDELTPLKQDSEFISNLLNLSTAYAIARPDYAMPLSEQFVGPGADWNFFLDANWLGASLSQVGSELTQFLQGYASRHAIVSLLQYQSNLLSTLCLVPSLVDDLRNPQFIRQSIDSGKFYFGTQITSNLEESVQSQGILDWAFYAPNRSLLRNAAHDWEQVIQNPNFVLPSRNHSVRNPLASGSLTQVAYGQTQISQGLIMRIEKSVALSNSVPSLDQFLSKIEGEERHNAAKGKDKMNRKDMITSLRKIFYTSDAWNKIIIPDTERIPTKNLSQSHHLRYWQEVVVPGARLVDMGHIFCALDAANRPKPVPSGTLSLSIPLHALLPVRVSLPRVDSNIDNATFVGDMGGVIRSGLIREAVFSGQSLQALIDDEAEPQDMLGDIDGIVIALSYRSQLTNDNSYYRHHEYISDILKEYYTQRNHKPRENRFKIFADHVGLGTLSSSDYFSGSYQKLSQKLGNSQLPVRTFSGESDWIEYYTTQVAHSAAQFLLGDALQASSNKKPEEAARYVALSTSATQQQEVARKVLRCFVEALKRSIRANE